MSEPSMWSRGYPSFDAGPAAFRPAVTPTIGGTPTPVVAIASTALTGAKRIDASATAPTLAATLAEQVRWSFSSTDAVKKVHVGLRATDRGGAQEVAYLKVSVNPGDDVTAATRLTAGYPEVFFVYPGETLEIESDTAITDVYAIAALTSVATPATGGATMDCKGVSYV